MLVSGIHLEKEIEQALNLLPHLEGTSLRKADGDYNKKLAAIQASLEKLGSGTRINSERVRRLGYECHEVKKDHPS